MPWQRYVLDVALEIDPKTGKLVYREVILTVPRQSGKTTLLLVLILLRALGARRQVIRYTAQTGADARKKWTDDWLPVLEESKFASQFRARLTNGHEALLFKNGSQQGLLATTKKTGHGGTVDLGILDEAFAHPDARLEQALKPAMITRPQPQLWVVSTAGTSEDSPYLWGKVENGRAIAEAGLNHSVAYFEWSADDELDPADPATWQTCMPALGHTATIDAVASDFESMELNEFERAYLNRWKAALTDPVIALEIFAQLLDEQSSFDGAPCFAFDVTPDRDRSSIAAAGNRSDGLEHIEVIENRPGTKWVPGRLAELKERHGAIAIICDAASPAASLVSDCKKLELEIKTTSAQEHAEACGMFFDGAGGDPDSTEDPTIRHLGTPELIAALAGAVKRPLGDAGWAWSRKSSNVDISPLVAATLSYWGLRTQEPSSAPGVWDLNEIVAQLRAEQNGAQAGEPGDEPEEPGAVRFIPI